MALWGEASIMIHRCMYTLTTNGLHMQYYKHNTRTVLSVQVPVQLHEQVNGILEICTSMS